MALKKLVHHAALFFTSFFIGEWPKIGAWVHQPGGPPMVPEKTSKPLIYNGFLDLVVSPPQATIFASGEFRWSPTTPPFSMT